MTIQKQLESLKSDYKELKQFGLAAAAALRESKESEESKESKKAELHEQYISKIAEFDEELYRVKTLLKSDMGSSSSESSIERKGIMSLGTHEQNQLDLAEIEEISAPTRALYYQVRITELLKKLASLEPQPSVMDDNPLTKDLITNTITTYTIKLRNALTGKEIQERSYFAELNTFCEQGEKWLAQLKPVEDRASRQWLPKLETIEEAHNKGAATTTAEEKLGSQIVDPAAGIGTVNETQHFQQIVTESETPETKKLVVSPSARVSTFFKRLIKPVAQDDDAIDVTDEKQTDPEKFEYPHLYAAKPHIIGVLIIAAIAGGIVGWGESNPDSFNEFVQKMDDLASELVQENPAMALTAIIAIVVLSALFCWAIKGGAHSRRLGWAQEQNELLRALEEKQQAALALGASTHSAPTEKNSLTKQGGMVKPEEKTWQNYDYFVESHEATEILSRLGTTTEERANKLLTVLEIMVGTGLFDLNGTYDNLKNFFCSSDEEVAPLKEEVIKKIESASASGKYTEEGKKKSMEALKEKIKGYQPSTKLTR